MVTRRTLVGGLAAAPLATALGRSPAAAQEAGPVRIGSKNFTEQLILGEMYAQLLERAGIPVELSLNLGGTAVAHAALVGGDISLYPEYTGTALTEILEVPIESVQATPVADGASIDQLVYDIVREDYAAEFDLVWLEQVPFNNTQALAVKRAFAEERGIATISELTEIASELTIVAPPDFVDRADGQQGLDAVYGLTFGEVTVVEPGIRYQALEEDQAEVVLAFGTDGQVAGLDLVLLEDDEGLWPPYHVAPVVRQDALDAYPALAETLNAVAPLLTDEVMAALNWQVDGPEGLEPDEVSRAFLEANGLLS